MTLGQRIREAREHKGLSAPEMARRVGVSKQMYYRWERNDAGFLKPENLFKVAKVTGYSVIWLQTERGEKLANDIDETLIDLVDIWTNLPASKRFEVLEFAKFKAVS